MADDLYVAVAGAVGRLQQLEQTANNLANADTIGFKRHRSAFSAALEAAARDLAGEKIEGAAGSVFAVDGAPTIDLAPGPVDATGRGLDAAIDGEGFFVLQGESGPLYTRAGHFIVSPGGQLASPDGLPVQGDGGPISVGTRAVTIAADGAVVDSQGETVGRLRVVEFSDPSVLAADGGNRFRAGDEAPGDVAAVRIVPGSVERSNVKPVEELAGLIDLQRHFEIVMRALQSDDQLRERLLQEVSA